MLNVKLHSPPDIQPANQQSTDTNTLPHTPFDLLARKLLHRLADLLGDDITYIHTHTRTHTRWAGKVILKYSPTAYWYNASNYEHF